MNKIIFEKVGSRLKEARERSKITLELAGNKVGVHKSTVLRWENGETEKIKLPILETLAAYYNVNPVWLMGYDVPMQRNIDETLKKINAFPVSTENTVNIPVLGVVKAGYDYLAQENWIATIDVDRSLVGDSKDFFALKVKGDSMSPVLIEDDIVIIKKQSDFETGDIVVAIVNGNEATIKKGKKTENSVLLQPLNASYEPLIFTKEEMKTIPVVIVGIVKQLKREF